MLDPPFFYKINLNVGGSLKKMSTFLSNPQTQILYFLIYGGSVEKKEAPKFHLLEKRRIIMVELGRDYLAVRKPSFIFYGSPTVSL